VNEKKLREMMSQNRAAIVKKKMGKESQEPRGPIKCRKIDKNKMEDI